ncbi:hypothetical protein GJ654_19840 [Rhodoblastus acidophilus]|uniref:Uncharacterized protein n=1 Tax=Rhodoblastus acidophilus TaxID=1074 RepID=A0A6N8DUH2_RHOAC|nr:hypothetical protein [Rhodoblastus acidophilus]MCW2276123.1 hypothetical protein [Rhodoblastus acidophilus]MTV33235.1 hypothetical protein [Rhodoblastus acidophilus]
MANPQQEPRWKIDSSEHDAQGFVACTDSGAIVWRGPLDDLDASAMPSFDTVFCHEDDVDRVRRLISKPIRRHG